MIDFQGLWRRSAAMMVVGAAVAASFIAASAPVAAVAPAEPALPDFPARPALDQTGYPVCRDDHKAKSTPYDKVLEINRCTGLIDAYYNVKMLPHRQAMIEYQNALTALYTDNVGGNMAFSAASQASFYQRVMAEHAASDPAGTNLAGYRMMEAQFQADRAYLQDRYCFNTGCGGYAVPTVAAPIVVAETGSGPADEKPEKKKKRQDVAAADADGDAKCKRTRKRGGGLGGMLGNVAGSAAGLGRMGSALSGVFGAVLVGEIACQLDEKEQVKAAEATVAVTQQESVGAVANWTSPTREGVSGSSTITALNAEPNGNKCLTITDVAIVEGEETRVSKRMCRQKGDARYTMMA